MDSERFDAITRMLALGLSRRSATFGLAALTGLGITQFDDAEAKKKRKKKKKKKKKTPPPPPPPTCRALAQTCSNDCCAGLVCEDSPLAICPDGERCRAGTGGDCDGFCDCRSDLNCSERQGDTCQDCVFTGADCPNGDIDCCLLSNVCDPVTKSKCNEPNNVCCAKQGVECLFDCECCGALGCSERTEKCEDCAFLAESCVEDDDCCLINSSCLPVTKAECSLTGNVCCQGEGKGCNVACDCCGNLVCTGNVCSNP